MNGIEKRAVLVTGGASGIGLCIATRLRQRGACVAIADLPGENLNKVAGQGFLALSTDVRVRVELEGSVASAVESFGYLDTLVVSAGVIDIKPLHDVTEDDWDRTLDINLKGAFLAVQAAAPALRASGRGRVLAISSDAGRNGVPFLAAYSASKAGLNGLVQSLAAELAPHVTVNAICPVSTPDTGMGRKVLAWKRQASNRSEEEVLREIGRIFPMGRAGTPDDIADAAEFLVSDSAGFITGIALDVDGGAALNSLPGAQP